MKYYKILNKKEIHGDLHYKTGLNVDPRPFNDDPRASCVEGGIYFSDAEHIFAFVEYGPWIREVKVPKGARMLKDPDPAFIKYRADKVVLGERRKWYDPDTLKELVNEGVNIHTYYDYALRWAADNGQLNIVQCLVENGADIHADNNYALWRATMNGHLEVVRYLVEQGADIHAEEDYALQVAVESGHLEVVRYLVDQGADIHVDNGYILYCAVFHRHLDIICYLVEKGINTQNPLVLRWIEERSYTDVAQYLKSVIAKNS